MRKIFVCFVFALIVILLGISAGISETMEAYYSIGTQREAANVEILKNDEYLYGYLPDGSIVVLLYYGKSQTVDIQSSFPDEVITSINDNAFDGSQVIIYNDTKYTGYGKSKQIIVPDTVSYLGRNWLGGSWTTGQKRDANIPKSLSYAGFMSFRGTIDNIPFWGDQVFIESSNFYYIDSKDLIISDGYEEISGWFIMGLFKDVSFPEGLKSIGDYSFNMCDQLEEVIFPSSLERIGKNSFDSCAGIKKIFIPAKLQSIGDDSFTNLEKLETVSFEEGREEISLNIFHDLPALKNIEFPSSLKIIGERCFVRAGINNVIIPSGTEKIENGAFKNCQQLKQVTLPQSLNYIADDAFEGCADNCVFSVVSDSYAEKWALEKGYNTKIVFPVKNIELSTSELMIGKGSSSSLKAEIEPNNATNSKLEWVTTDSNIATITNGVVKGVGCGECDIICSAIDGSGKQAKCHITVYQMIQNVAINEKQITLLVGAVEEHAVTKLTYVIKPEDAYWKDVTWESSNEGIVTVNDDGTIKGISAGKATVTAYTTQPGSNVKGQVQITVNQAVTALELDRDSVSIPIKKSETLRATISPANASNKKVTWTSSDENIVKVSAQGTVTAVAAGEAIVTATSVDGGNVSASCKVTVYVPVTKVQLSEGAQFTLPAGLKKDITATVTPEDATDKGLVWTSSNEEVATVDANGAVAALKKGTAKITATAVDGSKIFGATTVTVSQGVEGIEFENESISIPVNKPTTLKADISPADTANKKLEWSSSDETVAKVNAQGQVTGVSEGQVVITASSVDGTGVTGTCSVHVYVPVTKVQLSEGAQFTLPAGLKKDITATVTPEEATDKGLVWTSSNEAVATVDQNGTVVAAAKGNAKITATAVDGSKVFGATTVIVSQGVEGIMLDSEKISLPVNKTVTIKATISPADAGNKKLEWYSENEEVATVNANGQVVGKSDGTTRIVTKSTDGTSIEAHVIITVYHPVTKITIQEKKLTLPVLSSYQLYCNVEPDDATNPALEWMSSDESICTVDNNGLIQTVKAGDCVISCKTTDGSEKSIDIPVHVLIFDSAEQSFEIIDKDEYIIPIDFHGFDIQNISVKQANEEPFLNYLDSEGLHIFPIAIGQSTVTLINNLNKQDTTIYNIEVLDSALFSKDGSTPLFAKVVLDKPFIPWGSDIQGRYYIFGGTEPYKDIEFKWIFEIDTNFAYTKKETVNSLPTGSFTIKPKDVHEAYRALAVLTVRDSAGSIKTVKSNVVPYESVNVSISKMPIVALKGKEIKIDYQIMGGSGAYTVNTVWTVKDKNLQFVLNQVSNSIELDGRNGSSSYMPSEGDVLYFSIEVIDNKNKNLRKKINPNPDDCIYLSDNDYLDIEFSAEEAEVGIPLTAHLSTNNLQLLENADIYWDTDPDITRRATNQDDIVYLENECLITLVPPEDAEFCRFVLYNQGKGYVYNKTYNTMIFNDNNIPMLYGVEVLLP